MFGNESMNSPSLSGHVSFLSHQKSGGANPGWDFAPSDTPLETPLHVITQDGENDHFVLVHGVAPLGPNSYNAALV